MAFLDLSFYKKRLRPLLPPDWTRRIGAGTIGIGHDVATTEGELSNPSALAVVERLGSRFSTRLTIRWKAEEYKMRLALIELVAEDIIAANRRARRLVIDATNERSFSGMVRDQLAGRVPVEYYIASAGIESRGKKFSSKQLLGDGYCQTFEDNVMGLPAGDWVYADHQLVKASRGTYVYEEDSVGNHADAFVAGMLAVWALMSGGERSEISAAGPGDTTPKDRRGVIVPPDGPGLLF
ncbi:MAG: hypothetical protein V4726_11230 [Verrucomicrobiota bacterium]